MATRKKKVVEDTDNDIPVLATDAKAFKNKKVEWPKIEKGSHLTVYTYEDGSTKLEWDDEALARDVRQALLKYESTIPVDSKPKKKILNSVEESTEAIEKAKKSAKKTVKKEKK